MVDEMAALNENVESAGELLNVHTKDGRVLDGN